MNRRQFAATLAGAALATTGLPRAFTFPDASTPQADNTAAPKLSVMLWTVFTKLPFEQRLEKVAEAGYHAVELVDEFRHWSDADFRRASAKCRALHITFDATAGLQTGLTNPAYREKFLHEVSSMLPIMEKLECGRLIVLSGNSVPSLGREVQRQSCIEGLKRAADLVAGRNVTLLLENIDPEENPKYYLSSSREGFEIVRQVRHPNVRFLYDLYHEQIAEGNLTETLEKNFAQLGLVHVADVPGRHQPGTGEINFGNIFRRLAGLGYGGYVAMEFLPSGDPVATLRAARELAIMSWRDPSSASPPGKS